VQGAIVKAARWIFPRILHVKPDVVEPSSSMPATRKWNSPSGIFTMSAGDPEGALVAAMGTICCGKVFHSWEYKPQVWAAKFTARHPNLVALEVSSFKRGHDSPIYGVIEGIIEQSGTSYFCFKDLDENKPSGSINIRVDTIDYFLRRSRNAVICKRKAA
jgi:hypothetical protein